ncbi:NAD(P)-binding protein [Punctularia strigosozonata HHB-11173 SS5]|uniref:NAD(P)-binding protein n=1 Tax=Punctularia strigosozonata (strain HHB-11173) TaxID=741275 RepID=UPI0004417032|nr:NAD(P)-binding protein [Punctularia strigosozonata HHB-11173 SS5]EIN06060.1 NAD(P)-binding protein [Punctularia strigosozonata HHB-11173 SS5]
MAPVVYLVSGANRGIGFGLVKALSSREDTIVFAGVRDPDAATDLQSFAADKPGRVHIVKLVSSDAKGNEEAISFIREKAGRLDVVIANAGINYAYGPLYKAAEEDLRTHFEVNVVGTFVLFKAALPLLKASSASGSAPPKFVAVSSHGGSLERGASAPFDMAPYGISKAALNYLVRKLHYEHEKDRLVAFPISPGPVTTDMGSYGVEHDAGIRNLDFKTVDEIAAPLLKVIGNATRESEGGHFLNFDGAKIPW